MNTPTKIEVAATLSPGLEPDDIVQITEEAHHWFPCLIIVTEVKSWGVQGYMTIPSNSNQPNGNAFIRLDYGSFERVGKAALIRGEEEGAK